MYIGLPVKLGVAQAPWLLHSWTLSGRRCNVPVEALVRFFPKGRLHPDVTVRGPRGNDMWWPWEGIPAPGRRMVFRGRGADLSLPCCLLGKKKSSEYKMILGPQLPSYLLELPSGQHSTDFYVEGLAFPDATFPGLISLTISLLDASKPVGKDGSRRGPWASRQRGEEWVQSPAGEAR